MYNRITNHENQLKQQQEKEQKKVRLDEIDKRISEKMKYYDNSPNTIAIIIATGIIVIIATILIRY